ncbi:MAG: hypothetical protein LBB58_06405 [Cellulomonadaceae bacterium]|jgi:hypothetical protein|nr:hypothetical protein [Cellulomonadaceae bacterium]
MSAARLSANAGAMLLAGALAFAGAQSSAAISVASAEFGLQEQMEKSHLVNQIFENYEKEISFILETTDNSLEIGFVGEIPTHAQSLADSADVSVHLIPFAGSAISDMSNLAGQISMRVAQLTGSGNTVTPRPESNSFEIRTNDYEFANSNIPINARLDLPLGNATVVVIYEPGIFAFSPLPVPSRS